MRARDPDKVLDYLVGQVMAQTKGRANPQLVRALLIERLDQMMPAAEESPAC